LRAILVIRKSARCDGELPRIPWSEQFDQPGSGQFLQRTLVGRGRQQIVCTGKGEVEVDAGQTVAAGSGALFVFDPKERHEVRATSDARLLLVLAPWPGDGHPGSRD